MIDVQTSPPQTKRAPAHIPLPVVPPDFDAARDGDPPPLERSLAVGASGRELLEDIVHVLRLACVEIGLAAQVSLQQGLRLSGWGFSLARRKQIAINIRQAQERLGARMELLGCGEPAVRMQLAEMAIRRRDLELKGAAVRRLDAKRSQLRQQLAESVESQPEIPRELAPEREHLLALCNSRAALDARILAQRRNLFPEGRQDQLRVASVAGILCLLLLGGCGWMFSTPANQQHAGIVPPPVPQPIETEQEAQPEVTRPIMPNKTGGIRKKAPERPVEKVAKGEKPKSAQPPAPTIRSGRQDFWVEANKYFPRRRFVGNYVNDQPHGDTKCLDAKDRVICVEHYEHGVLNGKRTCFYPSGKKLSEMPFRDGVAQGTSTVWYESGVVAGTIEFVDGQGTGESITYFPNGKKSIKVRNIDNVPHGEMLHFRPDGQCFAASDWDHGRQIGQEIQWDITQLDAAAIEARARFSSLPVDWWP